jgi:hypothetical protein
MSLLTVTIKCDTIGAVRAWVEDLREGATVKDPTVRKLVKNFVLELLVYAVLVVAYFFLVLRFLAEPLMELFRDNLTVYAFVALGLIVAQAILLEAVASFIMGRLGLEQLE